MATSGGQPGNDNSARGKRWRDAILRALARRSGSVERGLDAAADKLALLAIEDGDKWAIEEIGDRVDGKPHQSVSHDGDGEGGAIRHNHTIEYVGAPAAAEKA